MITVEDILKTIPTLNASDLETIRKQAGLYWKMRKNLAVEKYPSILEELLFQDLGKYVKLTLTLDILKKYNPRNMWDQIRKICTSINEFSVDNQLGPESTFKLVSILVDIAASKAVEVWGHRKLSLILYLLTDMGSLLEESFPGYVGSDLFKKIILNE